MIISLIVALSENRVIGVNNQLPWNISEDLKRFKKITSGHSIIMGRKTFESIGKVLPNRTNIIITRNKNYQMDGTAVVASLEEAFALAKKSPGAEEAFVIGGGEIFTLALPQAQKLYLTWVHKTLTGNAFFPPCDFSTFQEIFREDHEEFSFVDLIKIR